MPSLFQFTHPGGVRLAASSVAEAQTTFQFTHPGGVRLSSELVVLDIRDVSIHAPGRGATEIHLADLLAIAFQFTHPGGVRRSPDIRA